MVESDLHVLTAMRLESAAVRRGSRISRVVRTGMGPQRATAAARDLVAVLGPHQPVAVVGVCGGLDSSMQPGDLVVASEVHFTDGRDAIPLASSALLAAELAAAGLPVHKTAIVTTDRIVTGADRESLTTDGARAVDMESACIVAEALRGTPDRSVAVVRVVLDTPEHELVSWRTPANVRLAWKRIGEVTKAVERWGRVVRSRHVLLAGPRSFCAGVQRAIDIVNLALDRFDPPVYVRRQIVHNTHVVRELEQRGAVFVQEVEEVPPGSVLVLAAHGVSPQVRADAQARHLTVIDATCPLVAKVHSEARRFAAADYDIVLIGHSDHEEVVGTVGEVPGRIRVIESLDDVDQLEVAAPDRVAYLTQTTLATDEVSDIISRLRERFPSIIGPRSDDICYATQNRQEAVAAIAGDSDVVLVVGSPNSSNSRRLAEVATRRGTRAYLIDGFEELRLEWLADASTIGVTAGASAPEEKVQELVGALRGLGPLVIEERRVREERVVFGLPAEVGS